MARSPAARTEAAAAALLAWLDERPGHADPGRASTGRDGAAGGSGETLAVRPVPARPEKASLHPQAGSEPVGAGETGTGRDGVLMAPPHTDWLFHRLTITGPAGAVADLRATAAGAGTIPWPLDLDGLEEDWLHLLVAPPAPHRRTLSLEGARRLASELREMVARRHALATSRIGHSRACLFDLHALCPVPESVLRLSPGHPQALAWLWTHWGTTQALRHVVENGALARRPLPPGDAAWRLTFWSADWTPWRALAGVAARWPALRLDVQPVYDGP